MKLFLVLMVIVLDVALVSLLLVADFYVQNVKLT